DSSQRCWIVEYDPAPANLDARRSQSREISRQIFWCHSQIRRQCSLIVRNGKTTGAAGLLVGVQHPLGQTLFRRPQSVSSELGDRVPVVLRQLTSDFAAKGGVDIHEIADQLGRQNEQEAALERTSRIRVAIGEDRGQHERLDRTKDRNRATAIIALAEQLDR